MADFHRQGGTSPELTKNQQHQKENFERNLPAWIRDGKEISITVGPGATAYPHGLNRMPKGWLTHSHKGDAHSIVEVSRNDQEIKLQNVYVGSLSTTCKLWIW